MQQTSDKRKPVRGNQALMNGDPVQISMHSNLIYSAFDPRFNVVSCRLFMILWKTQMPSLTVRQERK